MFSLKDRRWGFLVVGIKKPIVNYSKSPSAFTYKYFKSMNATHSFSNSVSEAKVECSKTQVCCQRHTTSSPFGIHWVPLSLCLFLQLERPQTYRQALYTNNVHRRSQNTDKTGCVRFHNALNTHTHWKCINVVMLLTETI